MLKFILFVLKVQRISKAFDQLIEQQIERRRRNIETPRFVLQRVINELEAFQKQLINEPNQRYKYLINIIFYFIVFYF